MKNQDSYLYQKAKYFYEMGALELQAHPNEIKNDLEIRLTVGYVIEQAIELTLKQILDDITGEHSETHKLYIMCNEINRQLSKGNNLNDILTIKLRRILNEISNDAKRYTDLAYGARYIPDLEFSERQLDTLVNIAQDLLLFYSTIEYEV